MEKTTTTYQGTNPSVTDHLAGNLKGGGEEGFRWLTPALCSVLLAFTMGFESYWEDGRVSFVMSYHHLETKINLIELHTLI